MKDQPQTTDASSRGGSGLTERLGPEPERAALERDAEALGFDIVHARHKSPTGEPWFEYRDLCSGHRYAGFIAGWAEQATTIARLREALQEADTLMGHDEGATQWRESWAHLWKQEGERSDQSYEVEIDELGKNDGAVSLLGRLGYEWRGGEWRSGKEREDERLDAMRYRRLREDFSAASLDIDGKNVWAYKRNYTLLGPTLEAAIDAAMAFSDDSTAQGSKP